MANGYVEDNNLKMDWEKKRWLKTKGSNSVFIMAGQDYQSTNKGSITVFFNAHMAWLWLDNRGQADEDIWTFEDLKEFVRKEYDSAFPYQYEQCIELVGYGDTECDDSVLEEFGLTAFKADIEARVADLVFIGEESDSPVSM